jgi:hypothetical protein
MTAPDPIRFIGRDRWKSTRLFGGEVSDIEPGYDTVSNKTIGAYEGTAQPPSIDLNGTYALGRPRRNAPL